MGELVKLKILLLSDPDKSFALKINPSSLNLSKRIYYKDDDVIGSSADVNKYKQHGPTVLSFDFILDSTGIAYKQTGNISDTIYEFEAIVYNMNGEKHEPNSLQLSWGSIVFNCRLETLTYDYTLFDASGEPLRVKVSVSFSGFTTRYEEVKAAGKSSPDLSHTVTIKAGESVAFWCGKIYGDPSYCVDVAHHNGLQNFRNIKPGTTLLFPPLKRNG